MYLVKKPKNIIYFGKIVNQSIKQTNQTCVSKDKIKKQMFGWLNDLYSYNSEKLIYQLFSFVSMVRMYVIFFFS